MLLKKNMLLKITTANSMTMELGSAMVMPTLKLKVKKMVTGGATEMM